jgi:quinol monooxygenase YgiN
MTILVTGLIELDPANRDAFVDAANAVMTATHQEDGCEGYAFSSDLAEPGRFYVAEQWASQETMDAHSKSAHLATFMAAMGGFGVTRATLTKWDGATPTKIF